MNIQLGRNPGIRAGVGGFLTAVSPAIADAKQSSTGIISQPSVQRPGSNKEAEWFGLPGELALLARKIYPASDQKGMKLRAKFVARSLVRLGLTHEWLTLWKTPELKPLAASCPRLLLKPQRLYLAFGLTPEQRWTALREHYAFALEAFSAAALQEVFHTGGVLLATVPTPGVGSFSLRLMYDVAFEMEGELSLVLWDDVLRRRTFTLSFSISSNQPGRRKIFIGGLQGFKAPVAKQQAVDLTRAMFGLRPKALLLFALQQLAVRWDVRQIGAVSNEKHTICGRSPRLRKLLSRLPAVNRIVPPRDMQANYDEFWLESGGRREKDGCFILPVAFEPRPVQSIRRNKRQLYRRRYGLLATLGTEIEKNLSGLTLPTR